MLKNISKYYWPCQIGGWLFWMLLNLIMANYYGRTINERYYINQVSFTIFGILVTHLIRFSILKLKLIEKPLSNLAIWVPIMVVSATVILMLMRFGLSNLLDDPHIPIKRHRPPSPHSFFSPWPFTLSSLLIMVWIMLYFIANYFQREQQLQIDKLQLESTVKELELRTLKSQLNPHFLFNSLNSIRALVDENPKRARTAVTELSSILRGSMQVEKMETVELEQELKIIKDYLALEQIRFEERLQVNWKVADDTLKLPIPPMMLQTLVENGIKHGISKKIEGGEITIISEKEDGYHKITLRNTGHFHPDPDHHGFGLKSTRQRLNLLYKDKATFEIHNLGTDLVETKIKIPLAKS